MKDYRRQHPEFSLCGLNCTLCPMHLGGHCPGCGGGEGHQSCAFIRCSRAQGPMAFCFECGAYPCERIRQAEAYDSFLPHRNMRADAQRAQEMGLAAYLAELQERAALLERLLAGYNDGRRKGLFCAAAYLLEVEALRQTVEALEREAGADWPIRQRAELAAGALAAQAARLGVDLKLHKKPRER